LQKLFKKVDMMIEKTKMFSVFAVSLSEVKESVVEQWINCLTRLITHDYDHKSWNYANEFDIFICPRKNPAKRFQQEHFNSMVYTGLISLYLDKHVSSFLSKFPNITNSLACIIRSFQELEYLRVLAAVIMIVGVHLVEPYLSLTTSFTTTWCDLVKAFPSLYRDPTTPARASPGPHLPRLLFHLQEQVQTHRLPLLPPEAHHPDHRAVQGGDMQDPGAPSPNAC
jgi:hypothetical protein